jgi:hypothetical protein
MLLGGNNFNGSIPESLATLPLLRQLWLNDNNLVGTIPESLAALPLKELRLSGNKLTGVVPNFSFENITACELENPPNSSSNSFVCPLPPNSSLCKLGAPRCK